MGTTIFDTTVLQVRFIIAPGQTGADQPIENLREQLLLQVRFIRSFHKEVVSPHVPSPALDTSAIPHCSSS